MKAMIQKFFQEENGASAVEYGLLVSLIAVAIIVGATAMGTSLNSMFTSTAAKIVTP